MSDNPVSLLSSRPTPLRTRVFFNLVPLVVILAGFGIFAYVLFTGFSQQVRQRVEVNQRLDVVADRIGASLSKLQGALSEMPATGESNSDRLERSKDYLREVTEGVDRLRILDTNRLNTALLRDVVSARTDLVDLLSPFLLSPGSSEPSPSDWGRKIAHLNRLLEELGLANQAGAPVMERSFDELHGRVITALVSGGLLAVGIAGLCCYFLARSIMRPIHEMTDATWAIADGHLDHRVSTRSADELGKLARAFNRMADRLQAFRRSQDETVVRAHQFMEATIASFPDPVFIFQKDGALELKNTAATEWLKLIDSENEIPAAIEVVRDKVLKTGEHVLPEKYGDALTWRIRGRKKFYLPRALIIERDSVVSGVALVLHDVTNFRLMDEVKSSMIGTVSHEIKTPLTSVSMVLHLLIEESVGELNDDQKELVETALDDTNRLMDVVNDLLDMSRIEQGRVKLDFEETDPGDWLQGLCDEFETVLEAKHQSLTLKLKSGLPAAWFDRGRLSNAVRNLIENAHKYAPPNSTIEVAARSVPGDRIELTVADEGEGIPEELHDKIFEKFFRAPGSGEPGTGLGLSLTREIVQAHDGQITVCNRPDGGSEFTIKLPVQPHECRQQKENTDSR